jgi:serine protease Do
VAEQLQKSGKVARGWLGITTGPVDAERARQLAMPRPQGVYVVAIVNRSDGTSPAASAGIRPGDVILQWNGQPVETMSDFARRVASTPAGSNVQLTLFREGQPLSVTAQVAEHP